MRRQLVVAVAETAQVDDTPHASRGGRRAEPPGRLAVNVLERAGSGHRVHQVERNVDSDHRLAERVFVEAVALHDLGSGTDS